MIKFTVITLFPEMIETMKSHSAVRKAMDKNLVELETIHLKEFGKGLRQKVDDTIYGGGAGMLISVEALDKALTYVLKHNKEYTSGNNKTKIIYLTPKGKVYTQNIAFEMANTSEKNIHYVIICGHYEGIDERIFSLYEIEEISIGDYVLTGGEIPAMTLIDSISRLVDGVLKKDSILLESHTEDLLEEPKYTNPKVYKGLEVPEVLLSGNHKMIAEYMEKESIAQTKCKRPDMYLKYCSKQNNKIE